jgi:hypothetical protein
LVYPLDSSLLLECCPKGVKAQLRTASVKFCYE